MSQIWAIIIVAWLISLWNRKLNTEKTISVDRKHISVVYLILIAGLLSLISPDISELDRDHEEFRERFEKAKISPRFWEQGLILEDVDNTSGDIE